MSRRAHWVAGTIYAAAMAAVATAAAWPVYADPRLLLVAAAAVAAAVAVSAAATAWRFPGWLTVLVAAVVFAGLGVGVAVPAQSVPGILDALREVAAGAVTGWKDLVTVDLPVGTYRNLLVPALVVIFGGTLGTLRLAWRPERFGAAAVVVGIAMSSFGLLFGRTVTSSPIVLGPLVVPAPWELLGGALSLVFSLAWLGWRAAAQRRRALAGAAGTVRVAGSRRGSDLRRAGLAAGMVVVALAGAAIAGPAVASGATRDVLRSGTGPERAISRAVSPLTEYRESFTDEAVGAPLFTVTADDGPLPDRIRLATLTSYDGAEYRVSATDAAARFLRVPAALPGGAGEPATVRVRIQGLRGIWLPTFGALRQLRFTGPDAAAHADAFYYDAGTAAGVQTDGVADGEQYVLTATRQAAPELASLRAPGLDGHAGVDVPDSVKTWIQKQGAGTGGPALATLVQRLRERGYLSHALSVADGGARWMSALGDDYVFAPSASGHSLGRIDAMFRDLITRQDATDGGSLVAATGDDEQFSVAAALIARQLGFPARVVVGARLSGPDTGVPVCREGVCAGGNITAWTEVQDASGQWVAVDVTPQHTEGALASVIRQRDPRNPTDVRPQTAQEVDPPDPTRHESADAAPREDGPVVPAVVWQVLRIAGISLAGLLVVAGPFAAVIGAKALRRRARRTDRTPAAQVVGGWEEYVDAAVDHGLPGPVAHTRGELAAVHASTAAATLAVEADRAVFSGAPLSAEESARFWQVVDAERRRLAEALPLWRRMLAAVSLTSFARGLSASIPRPRGSADRTPDSERRGRDHDRA